MEELFMEDMFPRRPEQPQTQKQSAWIEKAKQTIQGEKKVEPFNFTAAVSRILCALLFLIPLHSHVSN
jgi:hypothetical protein